jgi:hypothetical protein
MTNSRHFPQLSSEPVYVCRRSQCNAEKTRGMISSQILDRYEDAFLTNLTVNNSIGFHETLIFFGYSEGGMVKF